MQATRAATRGRAIMTGSRTRLKILWTPSCCVHEDIFMDQFWSNKLDKIILVDEELEYLERQLLILLELCKDYMFNYLTTGGNWRVLVELKKDLQSKFIKKYVDSILQELQFDIVEDPQILKLMSQIDYFII